MAQKMALVPPELVSEYYQLTKPEVRLEDSITNILHQTDLADELRVKMLSNLIPKYQKLMQPSVKKFPETFLDELNKLKDENPVEVKSSSKPSTSYVSNIAKYLAYIVPKSKKVYIHPILEQMKNAGYTFNENNELVVKGNTEHNSNVVDLFGYLMRNLKTSGYRPIGFNAFINAIQDTNIPKEWIGNTTVRNQLYLQEADPFFSTPGKESKWTSWREVGTSPYLESTIQKESTTPRKESKWSSWGEVAGPPLPADISNKEQEFTPDIKTPRLSLINSFKKPKTDSSDSLETLSPSIKQKWKNWR